jgi:hypothetical protein
MVVKRDQVTGGVLVIIGVVVVCLVSQFSVDIRPDYPGPKVFPLISAFGFIICGAGIFIKSFVQGGGEEVRLTKQGWVRIVFTLGILAIYVPALMTAGFLPATPVFLFIIVTVFAGDKKPKVSGRIIFSVVFTAVVYLAYAKIFGLSLPRGMLF